MTAAVKKPRAPRKAKATPAVDRTKFLGGSDAAAVLGVSPWLTPVQLWKLKTGRAEPQKPDPVRQRMLERGKKLEPVVLDMVLDKLAERGLQVDLVARNAYHRDPEHDFLRCEIDFELVVTGEVQIGTQFWKLDRQLINGDCKTVHGFARRKWGEEDTEEVPIEYAAQFMHGLMVTGRQLCLVAALIGLDDVQIFWVVRDDVTIDAMREKELAFWHDCVQAGRAPDPIRFGDIKELYPVDNGRTVEATAEVAAAAERHRRLGIEIKLLQAEREDRALEIASYVGDFRQLTVGGRPVMTFSDQPDNRLDERALRAAHPDLCALFERGGRSRVMRHKVRR
jgi:putative phage-type endonuclease